MLLWLFLAFTLVPIVEIALFLRIGAAVGPIPTVAIVLLTGFAGAALARSQGIRVMLEIQTALTEMKLPAAELLEGAIVLVGAVTLLTPGFMTDAVGLACLLPPSRKALAAGLGKYLARRIRLAGDGSGGLSGAASFKTAGDFSFRVGGVRPGPSHPSGGNGPPDVLPDHDERPVNPKPTAPRTIDARFTVIDGGRDDDPE